MSKLVDFSILNNCYKKTKIISTLGPSITGKYFTWEKFNDPQNKEGVKQGYEKMEQLFRNGVNVVRFNFSHGGYEEQSIRIKVVREVAQKLHQNIALLLDTKGPEIRVGKFIDDGTLVIEANDLITIYTIKNDPIDAHKKEFYVYDSTMTYNMAQDVKIGGIILVDDGKLQLEVLSVDIAKGIIQTKAKNSWNIISNKRINLPGAEYNLPFLSEKDKQDIKFAVDNDYDYIALSFVNSANNIFQVRELLKTYQAKPSLQLIAKIESTQGVKNIDEIIQAADGVMVARGDLALEVDYFDIPYWEKYIIKTCRHLGKPCIVATQMLDSLERSLLPTRAEVTDVFFAVDRGADATMLSGETANGKFPIQAVKTMAKIDQTSEKLFDYHRAINVYFPKTPFSMEQKTCAEQIANVCLPNDKDLKNVQFSYQYIFVFNNDPAQIKALSSIRPGAAIIVLTDQASLANQFAINYGIYVSILPSIENLDNNYLNYCQEIAHQAKLNNCGVYFKGKIFPLK